MSLRLAGRKNDRRAVEEPGSRIELRLKGSHYDVDDENGWSYRARDERDVGDRLQQGIESNRAGRERERRVEIKAPESGRPPTRRIRRWCV